MFCGFTRSVPGHKRLAKGTPCEDAVEMHRLKRGTICAVADGHGDDRCKYANVGSMLATKVAYNVIRVAYDNHPDDDTLYEFIANNRDFLKMQLIQAWYTAVCEDYFRTHPDYVKSRPKVTEYVSQMFDGAPSKMDIDTARVYYAEKERLDAEVKKIVSLYGTTLNIVLETQSFIFIMGIGDGDVIAVSGKHIEWLLPPSEQFSTKTASLCLPPEKAVEKFRSVIIRKGKGRHRSKLFDPCIRRDYLLIATDGLRNSFTSDEMFAEKLLEINAQKSKKYKSFQANSKTWLEQLTKDSLYRDDISFGFIYG